MMAVAGIFLLYFKTELDLNFKSWAVTMVTALAALLELGWFVLLSRYDLRWRLATFGLFVVLIVGLVKTLRVDGTVNGTGLPKLAWRWAVRRAPLLGAGPDLAALAKPSAKNATGPSADVPQFFGPNRDGIVKNARLSADWKSTPPKELWRHAVGEGWSAFAVVDGRAYTEEQRGETECVTCYDLSTGALIWSHANAAHFSQWQSGDGPHATPSVNQGRVFAVGATGILNCLDAGTGRELWLHNVLAENHLPNLVWGVSASPLVFGDTVVVTGGLTNGPTVLAYRASNGEPLWRAGTDKASYASPILAVLAGRRVVLSCNAASLTAHDPMNGRILLDYPWTNDKWPKASQPVVLDGDRVFLSAGYGSGCVLLQMNAGSNGTLMATQLWKNLKMKTQFNSAAARNGFVYGLDDGLLACVDISTGERKWKEGRYGYGQTLLVDDFVLVQTETGDVVLAEAQPGSGKELGRLPALHDKTWNHPTLAGRFLLARNGVEAVCYELPTQAGDNTNRFACIEH
jgi:outer membrane protein assembly factor BamB